MGYPVITESRRKINEIGSIREMTNSSGAIQARYDYDPYGRPTLVSGTNLSDFQYAGYYEHQPSALNLTLFRAYSANTARWLSRDPLPDAERSQGPNLYEYVKNNPVDLVDPFGLFSCQEICSELGRVQNGINGIVNTLKNGTASTSTPTVSGRAGMGGSNPIETQFENNPINIATGFGGYAFSALGYAYINTLYYTGQTPNPETTAEMGSYGRAYPEREFQISTPKHGQSTGL